MSLMHLAPRAPAVQVYFNGNSEPSSGMIPSGSVADYYSPLEPGAYGISFKKTGSDSVVASLGTALYDSVQYYTLLLYNIDSTHAGAVRIRDDYRVLTMDKAYYRFFHMSPDIGAVDLYFDNNMIDPDRQHADNTQSDFHNQFTGATANTYSITVKKAGSDSVIAQQHSVFLAQGQAYTIYLKGIKGGTGNNQIGVGVLQAAD
ncbi:DUF4397 domain-containing protein [Longitalea luteola]|uniref:DUF4397 domain-containing protein n=1 Tax=Longitalea luteola TaxID=2812563 RepID=UPI001A971E3C|nr:DUF4397 domain-containing protein [Longitalea luteola]